MAMMQQPQMVPPGLQAMKPVTPMATPDGYGAMVRAVAQANDLNELARLAKMPYGFLAAGKINELNRVAQSAQAAEQPTQDLNQQNLQQLAQRQQQQMQTQIAQNLAANENMGVPNIVNQMEQNPTMLSASGGMVEGYNSKDNDPLVGKDFRKDLKEAEDKPLKLKNPGVTLEDYERFAGRLAKQREDFLKENPDIAEAKEEERLKDRREQGLAQFPEYQKYADAVKTIKDDKYNLGDEPTLTSPDFKVAPTDTNKFNNMLPNVQNPFASRMQQGETFAQMRERERQAAGIGSIESEMKTRAEERASRAKKAATAKNLLAFTKNVENRFGKANPNQTGLETFGGILQSLTELKVGKDIAEDAGKAEQDKFLDLMAEKRIARTEGDLAKSDQVDLKVAELNANRENERFRAARAALQNDKSIAAQMQIAKAGHEAKKAELGLKYKELKIKGDYYEDYNKIQKILAENKGRARTLKDMAALLKVSGTALGDVIASGTLSEAQLTPILKDLMLVSNQAQYLAMGGAGLPQIKDR